MRHTLKFTDRLKSSAEHWTKMVFAILFPSSHSSFSTKKKPLWKVRRTVTLLRSLLRETECGTEISSGHSTARVRRFFFSLLSRLWATNLYGTMHGHWESSSGWIHTIRWSVWILSRYIHQVKWAYRDPKWRELHRTSTWREKIEIPPPVPCYISLWENINLSMDFGNGHRGMMSNRLCSSS